MTDRETILRRKRAGMAALRARRRAERRCIDCAAGLQENDRHRCIECAEAGRVASAKYSSTKRGKAKNAAWQRKRYSRDPEPQREAARLRRKLSDIRAAERREKARAA